MNLTMKIMRNQYIWRDYRGLMCTSCDIKDPELFTDDIYLFDISKSQYMEIIRELANFQDKVLFVNYGLGTKTAKDLNMMKKGQRNG